MFIYNMIHLQYCSFIWTPNRMLLWDYTVHGFLSIERKRGNIEFCFPLCMVWVSPRVYNSSFSFLINLLNFANVLSCSEDVFVGFIWISTRENLSSGFVCLSGSLHPSHQLRSCRGWSVHLTKLSSWASLTKQLTSISCTYFRL